MSGEKETGGGGLQALCRYLAMSWTLHLAWEIGQLPLYTIWSQPLTTRAFAIIHCTLGDVMIAGFSLSIALLLTGSSAWTEPRSSVRRLWLLLVVLGSGTTIYSEWENVTQRGNWSYAPLMPLVPPLGTGLAPLLQWIIVPTLVLRLTHGRWPWQRRVS